MPLLPEETLFCNGKRQADRKGSRGALLRRDQRKTPRRGGGRRGRGETEELSEVEASSDRNRHICRPGSGSRSVRRGKEAARGSLPLCHGRIFRRERRGRGGIKARQLPGFRERILSRLSGRAERAPLERRYGDRAGDERSLPAHEERGEVYRHGTRQLLKRPRFSGRHKTRDAAQHEPCSHSKDLFSEQHIGHQAERGDFGEAGETGAALEGK